MFVGHYGVSYASTRYGPQIPLWLLFIAVQWLDVVWAPLVLLGIERVRITPGITASNPLDLYYMPYTHSLVAALLWAVAALLMCRWTVKPRTWTSALVMGGAVFSHWVLDFVVHRPDLPLYDNSMKVGLGLWNVAPLALALEVALLFGGMILYFRGSRVHKPAMVIFGIVMVAIQAYVFFGPPPASDRAAAATALVAYALFAAVIGVLERPARQLS